jgi:hypothetical protein
MKEIIVPAIVAVLAYILLVAILGRILSYPFNVTVGSFGAIYQWIAVFIAIIIATFTYSRFE